MISKSKVILLPLKGIYLRVTIPQVSRYGIMATELLAALTTDYHLLKREIVVYLVNLRHLLHSIPMDVCFASQLERCCYVSFRELILSCSTFEKNDSFGVFLPLVVMIVGVLKARLRDNDGDQINTLMECTLDREDYVSWRFPSSYLTLESRDEIFV